MERDRVLAKERTLEVSNRGIESLPIEHYGWCAPAEEEAWLCFAIFVERGTGGTRERFKTFRTGVHGTQVSGCIVVFAGCGWGEDGLMRYWDDFNSNKQEEDEIRL